ncbi:MAG: DNA polymerase IV [Rhodobacteraceae bacterium]|nr:DNA polymerase IV [Paracoccaceae bacterium]
MSEAPSTSAVYEPLKTLCRDCGWRDPGLTALPRCPGCSSPRLIRHEELGSLFIAHVDCDAFYASVEKRDDPTLADKPLIIGGGKRGVVSTACYIARLSGVRSAMPMFKALELCPKAVVLSPNIGKYVEVSRQIRAKFDALTPLVEPLSLDEAFLDLGGTERLHGSPPSAILASLAKEIETEIGVSISTGLAPNKFLAKIASDLDKPRGFTVIGAAEAADFLAVQPVSIIWGVGAVFAEKLRADGFHTLADLRRVETADLFRLYGSMGARLSRLSWGQDERAVSPHSAPKSLSAETTFSEDVSDRDLLDGHLWRLAEKVAARLKAKELAGRVVTLKLKTSRFKTITRRATLPHPSDLADETYRAAASMLQCTLTAGTCFRLIGVGISDLHIKTSVPPRQINLLDNGAERREGAERAMDELRKRFGAASVQKGRIFR